MTTEDIREIELAPWPKDMSPCDIWSQTCKGGKYYTYGSPTAYLAARQPL